MEPERLFVLGDSISIHYGPALAAFLAPRWTVTRKGQGLVSDLADERINGRCSDTVLAYLREAPAPASRYDLLLLNCGLWDVRVTPGTDERRVALERYAANLDGIYGLLEAWAHAVAWVRTTPVDDALHSARQAEFQRFDEDVVRYNAAADRAAARRGALVIDLYGFTRRLGQDRALYEDHVHFTPEVRALQAAYLAGALSDGRGPAPARRS